MLRLISSSQEKTKKNRVTAFLLRNTFVILSHEGAVPPVVETPAHSTAAAPRWPGLTCGSADTVTLSPSRVSSCYN